VDDIVPFIIPVFSSNTVITIIRTISLKSITFIVIAAMPIQD